MSGLGRDGRVADRIPAIPVVPGLPRRIPSLGIAPLALAPNAGRRRSLTRGPVPYAIGLGRVRFMLRHRRSSPWAVRSIAALAFAHPGERRSFSPRCDTTCLSSWRRAPSRWAFGLGGSFSNSLRRDAGKLRATEGVANLGPITPSIVGSFAIPRGWRRVMEKSFGAIARKIRGTRMSTVAGTFDANDVLADSLRGLAAKVVAKIAQTTPRTVENWQAGQNGPTWRATVAMLNNDELCARLLEAAGRGDLARHQETIAALKAALVSEGK